jgi:hypothetical protein
MFLKRIIFVKVVFLRSFGTMLINFVADVGKENEE